MSLLARFEITPYYGQIEMRDPNARDYPQWETGEEKALAMPGCIAVATQDDLHGKVTVEVWRGCLEARGSNLVRVYQGELILTGEAAAVGNTVGAEFHPVTLSLGRHRVTAFTAASGELPDRVYFLIED
jgi:hypothetical protein